MVSIRMLRVCSSINISRRKSKRMREESESQRPRNNASQSREPRKASEISVRARYLRALSFTGTWTGMNRRQLHSKRLSRSCQKQREEMQTRSSIALDEGVRLNMKIQSFF